MSAKKSNKSNKSNKSDKIKSNIEVQEPESCPVCLNTYTSILRKKCVCNYCKEAACCKCIERYLLDRIEDAHCLHCRVNYNDAVLKEICSKTYLQNVYFKHRQEILVSRERANLPGLQEVAVQERLEREASEKIKKIKDEINIIKEKQAYLHNEYEVLCLEYHKLRKEFRYNTTEKEDVTKIKDGIKKEIDNLLNKGDELIRAKFQKYDEIKNIRRGLRNHRENLGQEGGQEGGQEDQGERKKFIRRCTRQNCQGFLSTAWKCAICEYYSCPKCFVVKSKNHDDPHECKKEDLETAEMIRKDSKPCPNCGEFIIKSAGCSQMFCITCNTPWDWNTGKIVTKGTIHNPHYFEWMKRTGGTMPRNPADVPCGGYPRAWEIARIMPLKLGIKHSNRYYEFYRICQEIQHISENNYRSHLDNDRATEINVKFLLGDYDEKQWGRFLAINEKKRKRDAEAQEIFGAFRMIAVELINRVYNYRSDDEKNMRFSELSPFVAERILKQINVEIEALIPMINDAFRIASIANSCSMPFISFDGGYYSVTTKRFVEEGAKRRGKKMDTAAVDAVAATITDDTNVVAGAGVSDDESESVKTGQHIHSAHSRSKISHIEQRQFQNDSDDSDDSDADIQAAIAASLGTHGS